MLEGFVMDPLFEIVSAVEGFVSAYQATIVLATVILAAVCAITILTIYSQALRAQRWAKYFGLAFSFFAIQYLVQLAPRFLARSAHAGSLSYFVESASRILFSSCSILNNLLFLETARELLGKQSIFRKRVWLLGSKATIEIPSFSPRWPWILAVVSLFVFLPVDLYPWCRLPDALFSALCFFSVGYALSLNMKLRPRSFISTASLGIGLVYASIHIMYGLNPILARTGVAGISGFYDRLRFLDLVDWLILFPLKYGLFAIALTLLIKSLVVVSPGDVERMSKRIRWARAEYLESDGILKSIGESVQADSVELFIKAPSIRGKSMFRLKWERDDSAEHSTNRESLPSNKNAIEGWILLEGMNEDREFVTSDNVIKTSFEVYRGHDGSTEYAVNIEGDSLTIGVPISFHGAVIGCLKVLLKAASLFGERSLAKKSPLIPAFRVAAIPHIRSMADVIAPAVQSFRENDALNRLSKRFTKLQVKQPASAVKESVEIVTRELLDVLSPSAIEIQLDMGFQNFTKFLPKDDHDQEELRASRANHLSEDDSETKLILLNDDGSALLAIKSILEVKPGESSHRIGELILLVPSERDERSRPILGTNESYGWTVASLVANSLLDFVREYHNSVLKNLSVRLNSRNAMSVSGWLCGVEEAARSVGLLWAVAEQAGDHKLVGSLEAVEVIEEGKIRVSPYEELLREGTQLRYVPLGSCGDGAHGVVEVRLRETGKRIWFGVERAGFGEELEFPSPWKVFLEHFAEVADSALIRLTATMDMENLRIQAAQYQGLATVAVTTGTVIHQIVNMAKDQSSGMSTLLDARSKGLLTCDEDYNTIIDAMSSSADRLLELTSNITNVTKLDERRPCSLLDAVIHSKKLFEFSLSQREIELETNVPSDLMVDVPFHVAALAIANLISNAKDAIGARGRIVIEAEDSGEMIHCDVIDNGPGVAIEIKERIFGLGVTTKRTSGGWGLYLVARSLLENRGSIELSNSGPEGTKFTIRFPKERREELA
jgi:signal transduction histidine kinase